MRDDYRLALGLALGAVLGAGQLVRAFSLWTFAVVVVALAAAALVDTTRRRKILAATLVMLAATAVVAGPWYAHQSNTYANPIFDQPQVPKSLWERRPAEFYVDPGLPELITRPYRPSFQNRFWPTLYAEGWGDYFGVYAWQATEGSPESGAKRELTAREPRRSPPHRARRWRLALVTRLLRWTAALQPRVVADYVAPTCWDRGDALLHRQLPNRGRRCHQGDVHAYDGPRVGARVRLCDRASDSRVAPVCSSSRCSSQQRLSLSASRSTGARSEGCCDGIVSPTASVNT